MIVRENINFKKTGNSKSALGIGNARYRENLDLLVKDLTDYISSFEGDPTMSGWKTVWVKNMDPWEFGNRGNYQELFPIKVRSRLSNPRPIDKQIFKQNVRKWILQNTDFKIHQFVKDEDARGWGNDYDLILK